MIEFHQEIGNSDTAYLFCDFSRCNCREHPFRIFFYLWYCRNKINQVKFICICIIKDNLGIITSSMDNSLPILDFKTLSDGTLSVSIKKGYETLAENIVIPSTYEGKVVSTIASGGFKDCKYLKSIKIPTSVITINGYAFQNCTSLTKITMSNSVTSINIGAFYNCSKLEEIKLSDNLTYLDLSAFKQCDSLESLTLPASLTRIYASDITNSSLNNIYFENTKGWERHRVYLTYDYFKDYPSETQLENPTTAAKLLKEKFTYTTYNDSGVPTTHTSGYTWICNN